MALSVRVCLVLCFCVLTSSAYEIPNVTIQALKPKGIRVSIPDEPNVSLFTFNGNIKNAIAYGDLGVISGEVLQATNGRWVFEDLSVQLKVGDVINYYVFVSANSVGYVKDNLSFKVQVLEDQNTNENGTAPITNNPTVTRVRGGTAFAGQTIFKENFDVLDENVWQIQHFIPKNHPEYPFVSYQRLPSKATVNVEDGMLRIRPVLQQSQPGFNAEAIYSGTLNLFPGGCTANSLDECYVTATGSKILPPVISGRISSQWFAFTYGTVNIRAKLPIGDWIYPEILLESFRRRYGNYNYASGVIKIATARGNEDLKHGRTDVGKQVLYGGVIMSSECRQKHLFEKKSSNGRGWSDDFHIFSVRWTPDDITLSVDSEVWGSVSVDQAMPLREFYRNCTDVPKDLLAMGSSISPFDDFFSITLGLSAGGVTEFQDDVRNSGITKPWINTNAKGMLHFWQDMTSWYPTWRDSELIVDYVEVIAL